MAEVLRPQIYDPRLHGEVPSSLASMIADHQIPINRAAVVTSERELHVEQVKSGGEASGNPDEERGLPPEFDQQVNLQIGVESQRSLSQIVAGGWSRVWPILEPGIGQLRRVIAGGSAG